jgi:hypothetical protein
MITVNGYTFEGYYADLCRRFIEYKQSIGYKYGARNIRHIRQMNEYRTISSPHPSIPREYYRTNGRFLHRLVSESG